MNKYIQTGKFKAKCLKLIDKVQKTKKSLFGRMKGTIHVVGDIMAPIDVVWDADCNPVRSSRKVLAKEDLEIF